ncbi:ribonuclease III domain-containing protein [Tanacetum coccineum]
MTRLFCAAVIVIRFQLNHDYLRRSLRLLKHFRNISSKLRISERRTPTPCNDSYSLENNKEFSVLGERLIETTVALRSSIEDIDISLGDLNDKISEVSDVDTSCAIDGMRLGLQDLVRVSSSTDSSTSSIVCDAFRAMLWTIALDSGKCDDAHNVFWAVHGGDALVISLIESSLSRSEGKIRVMAG